MKRINNLNSLALVTVLAIVLMTVSSCRHSRSNDSSVNASANTKLDHDVDSIIYASTIKGDEERTLHLIDSFLNAGRMNSMWADMLRSRLYVACDKHADASEYRQKVVDAFVETGKEPILYSRAVVSLANYMEVNERYEEALRVLLPAVNFLRDNPDVSALVKSLMHNVIAGCQIALNRIDEGRQSYEESYRCLQQYKKEKYNAKDFMQAVISCYNPVVAFAGLDMNDERLKWVERCDSLLTWYREQPNADVEFLDVRDGELSVSRAEILLAQGKSAEAAKAFKRFRETDYSKTPEGQINSLSYLSKTGHYSEAADIYQNIDQWLAEWEEEINLEVIDNYYRPKFQTNHLAGRKDSAYAVAVKMNDMLHPAIVEQKNNDAAKLATIYDTQGKERKIAQQQAEIQQQRIVGLVIAIILLTIFFIIYTLVRRRAAKRLAEMKAARERMESELRIARSIQMSMVPSHFPDYEGLDMYASMTPAKEVGGDLYGYVLQGDKLYFALGDVSGKGVPASLFMAQATRLFRTLAIQGMMPAEICSSMNDALSGEDNESGMFVTFFLGLVDLKTGHLDFCNAGHNPPVLGSDKCCTDETCNFLEMVPNAPIGLFPGLEYEGEEVDNIKGCSLFIYTDGLNEAENRQQEQFGDDRLLDILRTSRSENAQQLVEMLAAEVEQHRDGAEPNDDLTMMCIRIKG
ncbi:PP2C family protein-serine/threonine phosphatase [Prevotella sp. tf2-5]|uniref:PP2C family protein-serine/threonine phosphatase n=1 Tax=Prevotella sp. tf2-5 TaxID=1761889 RepID=UPI0008E3FA8A|nr:PP2C family protein-serine/threonine phosphatase [Prevotella sp. tf2-5]SFO74347.1 Serine phosphatase RsbU, regulator of sigma subunit [Prevotella sp. tf2-5]